MNANEMLDTPSATLLLTAEVLLQRLLPPSLDLTPQEVEVLTLQAGLHALIAETLVSDRPLPRSLYQALLLRRAQGQPASEAEVKEM